ncbi:hypothetical protein GOP47_0007627 [Adiantum capillus-veneris]|uniref:Protein LHCP TRANSLOCATION DEFECT n=1 Tax=Adiantum capillus-veneris TaxID=13818 RepID=A0A9D4V192_ADICA|nr:hypothetical protein GOP47_0007627 [Adiantum capillus-veneris]
MVFLCRPRGSNSTPDYAYTYKNNKKCSLRIESMASACISCSLAIAASSRCHLPCPHNRTLQRAPLGRTGLFQLRRLCPPSRARTTAWFKFGTDSEKAGIYGSQGRDDFDRDDVEQYFNYMGMLATEGTYDKMEALLSKGIHPVDILLLLAASEGDEPKIQELMKAGAKYDVTDVEGRTALERAQDNEIRNLIMSFRK